MSDGLYPKVSERLVLETHIIHLIEKDSEDVRGGTIEVAIYKNDEIPIYIREADETSWVPITRKQWSLVKDLVDNFSFPKTKKKNIEVTSKEVDAVEDAIWCRITPEWWEINRPHLSSFWKKLATAFDYDSSKETEQ